MGSLYIFGVPIYEDAEAADKRREDKEDRKELKNENKDDRRNDRTDRVQTRNLADVTKKAIKEGTNLGQTAVTGETDMSAFWKSQEAIAQSAAGAVGAFFGGAPPASSAAPDNTLLYGGVALLALGGLAVAARK